MKEFFASPPRERPTELDRARMRKALDGAPARPRNASDNSDAVLSELRAVRSEVADLRDLLTELGQAPANDEVLTRKQTAELLGVCVESITRLVRDEGLPCTKLVKDYRFLRSQVLAWFAARGVQCSGEG